ncbi:histidine kinase [Sphingopyxis sp. SE2]|uniref:histidine kinase n=1 Tax=Sphingopyxis sp. SE2 TaxID=1586240 RepID=UPI0028C32DFC|nr:histidine kinase [Sphingopyxis sp. SE2]MDT7527764.1 histidine kinase [Sphingopyxis sp. SE2]
MSGFRVVLYVTDPALLASLEFALSLQGFDPRDGAAQETGEAGATCLVVEQRYRGGGLQFLEELHRTGSTNPAILLATNPTQRLRRDAARAGVILIEKPLLGEELTDALHALTPPNAGGIRRSHPTGDFRWQMR